MSDINVITGVVTGEFGSPILVTLVDERGNIRDLSGFTDVSVTVRSPDRLKSVTLSASFVTDGVDGKVQFSPADGDISQAGTWDGQITLLINTGVVAKTMKFKMPVEESLT